MKTFEEYKETLGNNVDNFTIDDIKQAWEHGWSEGDYFQLTVKMDYEKEKLERLLDQFAMAVLTGYSATPDERVYTSLDKSPEAIKEWQRSLIKHDAEYCYEMARAMVAEKSKQP